LGILTMIGKDKSYRRALRLSDIKLIRHLIRGRRRSGRHSFIIKLTLSQGGNTGSAADNPRQKSREGECGLVSLPQEHNFNLCCEPWEGISFDQAA
jgi:hypothetical protein